MATPPSINRDTLPELDNLPALAGRFSVLWGCLCNLSPTALPEPFYIPRRVVVAMEARAAVGAAVPTDG